jgi:hypothetical protein
MSVRRKYSSAVCTHTAITPAHPHKLRAYIGLSHCVNVMTVKLTLYVCTYLMMLDFKDEAQTALLKDPVRTVL